MSLINLINQYKKIKTNIRSRTYLSYEIRKELRVRSKLASDNFVFTIFSHMINLNFQRFLSSLSLLIKENTLLPLNGISFHLLKLYFNLSWFTPSLSPNGVTIGGKIPLKSRELMAKEEEKRTVFKNFRNGSALKIAALLLSTQERNQYPLLKIGRLKRQILVRFPLRTRTAAIIGTRLYADQYIIELNFGS